MVNLVKVHDQRVQPGMSGNGDFFMASSHSTYATTYLLTAGLPREFRYFAMLVVAAISTHVVPSVPSPQAPAAYENAKIAV